MAKAPPSLDDLRAQARHSFRYWHIYLMLRLREVEQHLNPAERAQLGSLSLSDTQDMPALALSNTAILQEYGLLAGNEILPTLKLPASRLPFADSYRFALHPRGQTLSLYFCADDAALELLRVPQAEQATLTDACLAFERMLAELSPQIAYESARLWAALHGARALDFAPLPSAPPSLNQRDRPPALPTRRRGKGQFREPN